MKNDLVDLFRWNTKVDIKNRDGKILTTLYIRLVGDVDYNQAQQFGLVASRKLRKRLRDKDSTDHQAIFMDIDDREKNDLVFGILISEMSNFREIAMAEISEDIIDDKLDPDATLEERENNQELEEKRAKEKVEKLRNKMDEKSNERKAELEKMDIEELRKVFIDSTTNYKCLEEFGLAFREYCVFCGTYNDPKFKEKAFTDFYEFRNSSPILKRQLIDAYLKLELTGEQLKN